MFNITEVKMGDGTAEQLSNQEVYDRISWISLPSNETITIVIDDLTRPDTHVAFCVVDYVVQRVGVDKTVVVVASGMHQAASMRVMERRLGFFASELRVYHHNPLRRFPLSGYVIAVGTALPHTHAGISGGGKIICPGLSDYKSVQDFHGFSGDCIEDSMTESVRYVDVLVNSVINDKGEVVDLFVGDPLLVREQVFGVVKQNYEVCIRDNMDVAILIPLFKNIDFLQSMNALQVCKNKSVVRNGGTICIWSPMPEGIGVHYLFQQPNGLTPATYDGIFEKELYCKTLAFVTDKVSYEAIQEYFDVSVLLCKEMKEFLLHVKNVYGKEANIVVYNGADCMIGT